MAQLLFYLQIVICPLIALNALIAIMGATFSKVLSIVPFHSKYTRALTFQNVLT